MVNTAKTHQSLLGYSPSSSHHTKSLLTVLASVVLISATTLLAVNFYNDVTVANPCLSTVCENASEKNVDQLTAQQSSRLTDKSKTHLLKLLLHQSEQEVRDVINKTNHLKSVINSDARAAAAMDDCAELLNLSAERIKDSIAAIKKSTATSHSDAHAWLSGVLTNHVTCIDGLEALNPDSRLVPELETLVSQSSAALAILVAVAPSESQILDPISHLEFPTWMTARDRNLLETTGVNVDANVVVAKDGSGKYKTVKEAVDAAPTNSKIRYVIYVKKGTYKENVEITSGKKNIMLVGDGMDSTIITGSLNVVDGSTTFKSATVAAVGDGFMAQDIGFQNTAGAAKHQAVALRVGSDQAIINRCKIDAYQDTLYTHTNRQFYRDSYITGTVDFIFGNAAVVFQNCKIVARKPGSGQNNMVTAQGRTDPNQNTGTSIQNCELTASADLQPVKAQFKTYLGRPWKEYSRTVVMQSSIADHVDPAGWAVWSGDFALKTLYYGEYLNTGAGAGTAKRVKWAGYHAITNAADAKPFTVAQLINGASWLKSSGVAYTEGL
uniref:Pectinesterase n=1 Tax=Kalanchoe fedtschenkoi TaxID=63787 RepID=A0A7N0ZWP3_KALFE